MENFYALSGILIEKCNSF